MERTINEIYNLIIQKKENARNHMERIMEENKDGFVIEDLMKLQRVEGNYNAYTDILILLETSGVVEDELIR